MQSCVGEQRVARSGVRGRASSDQPRALQCLEKLFSASNYLNKNAEVFWMTVLEEQVVPDALIIVLISDSAAPLLLIKSNADEPALCN